MSKKAVSVRDFSFRYQDASRYAVRHLDFTVEEGSFFGIIGANGSGKSTLCNALVGLVPHYFNGKIRGDVTVCGIDTSDTSVAELSTKIGLVFQNPFNQLSYTAETVAEELAFGLENHGVPREEMLRRIDDVSHLMRLDGLLDRNPLELSGGQVQRVALGSSLVLKPKVLVLDECTTQLDPLGAEEIFDIIKGLNSDGMTVIVVDHDMERLARCADTILALDEGDQVAAGSCRDVFAREELSLHGIDIPDYVRISRALHEEGLSDARTCITEEEALECAREAMAR